MKHRDVSRRNRILDLYAVTDMPHDRIAEYTSASPGSVKVVLSMARAENDPRATQGDRRRGRPERERPAKRPQRVVAPGIELDGERNYIRGPGGTWLAEHGLIQVLKRIASGSGADMQALTVGVMTPDRLVTCEPEWRRQLACIGISFGRRSGAYFFELAEAS
ncbi:hypothetical protein [Enterovirga rhinocerotis]|uniref:hypothetical protein n=1 Tax=Enterovirga rhinocerotis TaxID=1339210 RepID=UPI0014151124|nr:hypothetical protein [Enterovirga rhinocerotis]